MRSLLALVIIIVTLTGCSYHRDKNPIATDQGLDSPNNADSKAQNQIGDDALSFALVREKVFAPKCMTCHSGAAPAGGFSVETYGSVNRQLARVEHRVLRSKPQDSGYMPRPPAPPLTSEERRVLTAWIRVGAPEFARRNAESPSPAQPVPEPTAASVCGAEDIYEDCEPKKTPPLVGRWLKVKKVVFDQSCMRCHATDGGKGRVGFSTLEAVRAHINDILLEAVVYKSMPQGGPALNEEQLTELLMWVKDGMPN